MVMRREAYSRCLKPSLTVNRTVFVDSPCSFFDSCDRESVEGARVEAAAESKRPVTSAPTSLRGNFFLFFDFLLAYRYLQTVNKNFNHPISISAAVFSFSSFFLSFIGAYCSLPMIPQSALTFRYILETNVCAAQKPTLPQRSPTATENSDMYTK